ncbi:MAG: hypothetical protein MAG451_00651 [Anaerolineales bacterium]|nr:hypothetical protein [Anaerolineales bacterium]
MNRLLKHYCADVEFPHVSGVEHLEMLQIRDRLAAIEDQLSDDELEALTEADYRLFEQAAAFYAELSRFVDLVDRRRNQKIPASRWWWYLDVLTQLPHIETSPVPVPERARTVVE